MTASFSRSQFPNGGWQFHQAATKWSAPTPLASTFDQSVILIIKHRLANPAITKKNNLATDVVSVGNELESYTRKRLGIPEVNSPKSSARRTLPEFVAQAAVAVKRVTEGAAPLIEWLASGGQAVVPALASGRASICVACPKNQKGDYTRWFTIPASEAIRRELSRRNDLKLTTAFDDKLGVCEACYCPMKLKVHTPIEIIAKHMKPEVMADLDISCWITAEMR